MDAYRIRKLLKQRCGRTFLGVFSVDRLPKTLPPRRPLLLVCNTAPHDHPGEHWITLFIDICGEYFDSLGEAPPNIFKLYLEKNCTSFVWNNKQLQSVISSYCGHYVVYYSLMKCLNYSMDDITNGLTNDTALNDMIVHKFVCDGL